MSSGQLIAPAYILIEHDIYKGCHRSLTFYA